VLCVGLAEGEAVGVLEGELVRVELAAGDGDFAVPVPGRLQAPNRSMPSTASAAAREVVLIAIKATTLCASGYVSGTILHLKQGTDPHPQGIA
jgi:hypothetical protein